MLIVWPKPQPDESARIRHVLALPSLVGLVALHRLLRGGVPFTRWFSVHVMLVDQSLLNLSRTIAIDRLLAAYRRFVALSVMNGVMHRLRVSSGARRRSVRAESDRSGYRCHQHQPRQPLQFFAIRSHSQT